MFKDRVFKGRASQDMKVPLRESLHQEYTALHSPGHQQVYPDDRVSQLSLTKDYALLNNMFQGRQ